MTIGPTLVIKYYYLYNNCFTGPTDLFDKLKKKNETKL